MKVNSMLSDRRAFTLAELAVLLMVLGILAAITIPVFSNFVASNRIEGATNTLIADLHYARTLAVAKRKTYHIEFQAQSYRIVDTGSGQIVRTRALPTQLSCAASADPSFYAWGLADPVNINISAPGVGRTNALTLLANGSVTHD